MSMFYILDKDHNVIPATLHEWAEFFNSPKCIVAQDIIIGVRISTVFLGINHSLDDDRPLTFETMIFGMNDESEYQERCHTYDEAVAQHAEALRVVKLDLYHKTGKIPHATVRPIKRS